MSAEGGLCSWALATAMGVGFLSSVVVVLAYEDHRRLWRTSVLMLVASAVVTTWCSWGTYSV